MITDLGGDGSHRADESTPIEAYRSGDDPTPRRAAERAARAAVRGGIRALTMATAGWRTPPDFLVIGAKRGGTTSLWRYLRSHEGIMPLVPRIERVKGTYFFDEGFAHLGERWYRAHFPLAATQAMRARRRGAPVVVGEASPYYLYHPLAAERAASVCPDSLRLAILRDPVERAYSHWKERVKNGTETLTFVEALEAEPMRTAGEAARLTADPEATSVHHRHHSYVDQGRYAMALARWRNHTAPDLLEVWFYEEFFADVDAHLARFTGRFGLEPIVRPDRTVFNATPASSMPADARRFLEDALRDDAHALAEMLDRDLPWSWL